MKVENVTRLNDTLSFDVVEGDYHRHFDWSEDEDMTATRIFDEAKLLVELDFAQPEPVDEFEGMEL